MMETLRLKRGIQGPFLVVAPVSTLGHWQREVETLTDMNCVVYSGNSEDREIIREYEFKYDDDSKSSDVKFNVRRTTIPHAFHFYVAVILSKSNCRGACLPLIWFL